MTTDTQDIINRQAWDEAGAYQRENLATEHRRQNKVLRVTMGLMTGSFIAGFIAGVVVAFFGGFLP